MGTEGMKTSLVSREIVADSIAPGKFKGCDVTIQEVFEAVGKFASKKMSERDYKELEDVACPAAGACGGPIAAVSM